MNDPNRASNSSPSAEEVLWSIDAYFDRVTAYCGLTPEIREGSYDTVMPAIVNHLERHPNVTRSQVLNVAYTVYSSVQWRKFKASFSFSQQLMKALIATSDAPVYREILEKLPFPAFFLYAPDETGTVGYLVSVETPAGTTDTLVCSTKVMLDDQLYYRNRGCALWFKNGHRITETLLADPEDTEKYGGADSLETYRENIIPALMAAYYLCSENAVIHPVRTAKKKRPKRENGRPLNIRKWDVGFREGIPFHEMYRELPNESAETRTRTNSVRPHVRRAHWHHYRIGPGRTKLIVKWIAPTFVMGTPADIPAVNHEAS